MEAAPFHPAPPAASLAGPQNQLLSADCSATGDALAVPFSVGLSNHDWTIQGEHLATFQSPTVSRLLSTVRGFNSRTVLKQALQCTDTRAFNITALSIIFFLGFVSGHEMSKILENKGQRWGFFNPHRCFNSHRWPLFNPHRWPIFSSIQLFPAPNWIIVQPSRNKNKTMITIPNPTSVNPQLPPTANNNFAHWNILPAKKIVRAASSSDSYPAHDNEYKNYTKNHEILVTKPTSTIPPGPNKNRCLQHQYLPSDYRWQRCLCPLLLHSPAATTAASSNADTRSDESWPPIRPPSMPSMANIGKSYGKSIARLALRRWRQAVTLQQHMVTACTAVGRQEMTERMARKQRHVTHLNH